MRADGELTPGSYPRKTLIIVHSDMVTVSQLCLLGRLRCISLFYLRGW